MIKLKLIHKIFIAIVLGLLLGGVMPEAVIRIFLTFNSIFSEFLNFFIPLIILGLIAPSIADLGGKAKKLLLITVLLAYVSTLFAGFFTYFTCSAIFTNILEITKLAEGLNPEEGLLTPFFSLKIPALLGVMSALVFAFAVGIGMTSGKAVTLHKVFSEFRSIVENIISYAIIPLLPFFIFGIFLNMRYSGAAFSVISLFGKIILVIFVLHIFLLILLFTIAGAVSKKNPFKMLFNMMPAYMTALGTSSSAATIPVTLAQTKKIGVAEDISDFCVPLCAAIHMTGSMMKIVATSLAISIMQGMDFSFALYTAFIFTLTVSMIAAPGVPGGAIMVAAGVLASVLGFDAKSVGLMTALYISIDSFGTACNVTGDGAIAVIVDTINKKRKLT